MAMVQQTYNNAMLKNCYLGETLIECPLFTSKFSGGIIIVVHFTAAHIYEHLCLWAACSVVVKLLDLDLQGLWFDPCGGQDKI